MPRLPIDYSKAFIYKICCKDKNIEECYIGSSTNFVKRKNHHKTSCNNINNKEYNQKNYIFIRENGEWNNWEMVLIHNFPCENKRQLEKEEERIRREYQNTLNSIKAYITKEEKIEYKKQYCDSNKERNTEYQKEYYSNNKDKIAEQRKQYYNDSSLWWVISIANTGNAGANTLVGFPQNTLVIPEGIQIRIPNNPIQVYNVFNQINS